MAEFAREYEKADVAPAPAPVEQPKEPSSDALLAQKDAELQALKQEMAQKEAAFDARFQGLERMVSDGFRNRATPVAPAPAVDAQAAYRAAQDLGLSDEEILANPLKSFERIRDHLRDQIRAEVTQEFGGRLQNLAVTAFTAQMDALKSDPYYEDLKDALVQYFQENPGEAENPGQIRRIYNELIGVNIAELQRRQATRAEKAAESAPAPAPVPRARAVEPSYRAPSAPLPEVAKPAPAAEIDEAEAAMMEAFNKVRPGLFKNTGEWAEVAQSKRFPKQLSSDIQFGRSRPNTHYPVGGKD